MRSLLPFILLAGPVLTYVISPSLRIHHSLPSTETVSWHLAARLATPEPVPVPAPQSFTSHNDHASNNDEAHDTSEAYDSYNTHGTYDTDTDNSYDTRDISDPNDANEPDPVAQLLQIMPSANTCTSSSPFPSECATADTAVDHLIDSFSTYSVTTAAEQAALLSWIAFESGELKFNQNHFPAPGRPGQGTRTMMMPNFVAEYAASIPELAAQVAGKSPAEVLALVQGDEFSFGSAAWFYASKCTEQVKQGLRDGGRQGWEAFVSGCVGTAVDEGVGGQSRIAYWERARSALDMST